MIDAAASVAIDRFDGPEWALVIVATISAVSSIAGLVITNQARRHSRIVRSQVENEHQDADNPILRDDLDAKDNRVNEKLDRVLRTQERTESKVGKLDRRVGLLEVGWQSNRERIESLEDTDPARVWAPPQTRAERKRRQNR